MARKNASNLDNQISLLDMMVSESPEYRAVLTHNANYQSSIKESGVFT